MNTTTAKKQDIIARTEPMQAPALAPDGADSFVSMIERAARDPNVDIDKMERLLAMKERAESRMAETAFNGAMTQTQSEMRPVVADAANPQTKSKYASYLALDKAMRPIYTKNGFALSFTTAEASEGNILVVCDVSHRDGHTRRYSVPMPADGKGAKGGDVMTKTHAVGAAMTYGQRYLLKMIFNMTVGNDTDGNGVEDTGELISSKQVAELKALIESTGGNVARFCTFAKVEKLDEIYASRFDAAKAAVTRAAEQRKAQP